MLEGWACHRGLENEQSREKEKPGSQGLLQSGISGAEGDGGTEQIHTRGPELLEGKGDLGGIGPASNLLQTTSFLCQLLSNDCLHHTAQV